MKYHVLLGRDHTGAPWSFYFGDYDRETVQFEKQAMRDQSGLKIVTLSSDAQADIDAYIQDFNALCRKQAEVRARARVLAA